MAAFRLEQMEKVGNFFAIKLPWQFLDQFGCQEFLLSLDFVAMLLIEYDIIEYRTWHAIEFSIWHIRALCAIMLIVFQIIEYRTWHIIEFSTWHIWAVSAILLIGFDIIEYSS